MAQLVFLSDNTEFAAHFAAIVRQEMGHELLVNPPEEILPVLPVLQITPSMPRRIGPMLREVERALDQPKTRPLSHGLVLHEHSRRLTKEKNGQVIELTQKEQELLSFLYGKHNVARGELLQAVWGISPDVDTHTLETHIYRLRQKWRDLTGTDCIVATETGYGWNAG